ncbi:uncharacterized protein LOC115687784 isoform X2 [Syzygium oleosum]|uniref:uncharacterized protein LOC115687784 isoform X2 n=1 Tax=Syzygium oleosum TaxID=219896 RepID=UPI0011D17FF0|nr:uncharacterized protein LOC115687784 isoform X2 [Syzygium oleosum]
MESRIIVGRNEMGHLRVLGWNDNIAEYKWYATEKKSCFFHRRDEELKKQGRERVKQSMGLPFKSRMKKLPRQCLLNYENLTLPPVVVMTANIGCARCQDRVSQVISKMDGVHDYTVDIRNEQVTVKGDFKVERTAQIEKDGHQLRLLRYFRISCLSKHLGHRT